MVLAESMTPVEVITKATFPAIPTALIAVSLLWYLWSVRRLRSRGRKWPVARTASFCAGELMLALGLVSGIDAYDEIFTVHTLQHILIGMLAPIFLALSAPVTLALQASNRRVQTSLLKVLHSRVAKVITHPAFTWPFYGLSVFGLYFTSLYAITVRDSAVHDLVHVHLIVAGCLFWWPAIGVDPIPNRLSHFGRMFYLLLAMPFHTILGMALESQSTPIAPGTTLTDLHTGGGLMWVAGEAAGLLGTIAVFVQWLRSDEREAKRHDRITEEAAARQLARWRATREAAARAASR
jgi:putative copper resistance protein D